MPKEIPLPGGHFNVVVRVGDTVRRPAGPWTATTHELLRHVRANGFELAPEPLGRDEKKRESLRYIEGDVDWIPPDIRLHEVGELVRNFHRAVATFTPPSDAAWRYFPATTTGGTVIHGDITPRNVVVRDREFVGLIDWDLARPGDALYDVAYAAWRFSPLYADDVLAQYPDVRMANRERRFAAIARGYGIEEDELVAAVPPMLSEFRDWFQRHALEQRDPLFRKMWDSGTSHFVDSAMEWFASWPYARKRAGRRSRRRWFGRSPG
jgi:hypothetical protein